MEKPASQPILSKATSPNKIYLEIFQWPSTGSFHFDKLPAQRRN
ncbi:MAG TPA: hypothetical protein VNX17_11205 [Edaphobacter sp.]|nr:hypothetical protein [Edaphobacter sp.]